MQIESHTKNAFEIAESVVKRMQLIKDLEKEGTPESVSKVENVQELLNGVKDFITDNFFVKNIDSMINKKLFGIYNLSSGVPIYPEEIAKNIILAMKDIVTAIINPIIPISKK